MRKLQTGSAVIEGLTAITVFSIGILGLIGLQANVLEHNAQAQFRTEASYFAQEIIGLALADSANATCYTMNPVAGACSNASAQAFAEQWVERVQAVLPGTGATPPRVTYAADGTFQVTIQWKRDTEDTWHNYVSVTNIEGS
jgi:type IV pilus assembly protein PilV